MLLSQKTLKHLNTGMVNKTSTSDQHLSMNQSLFEKNYLFLNESEPSTMRHKKEQGYDSNPTISSRLPQNYQQNASGPVAAFVKAAAEYR